MGQKNVKGGQRKGERTDDLRSAAENENIIIIQPHSEMPVRGKSHDRVAPSSLGYSLTWLQIKDYSD